MTVGIVLLIAVVIAVVVVGVVVLGRGNKPWSEQSTSTDHSGEGPTGTTYVPGSRPAGPGAESMDADELGDHPTGPDRD